LDSQKHILVCPLHWGLGHASRMIPVIYAFLGRGCKVTIVASGGALQLLKEEFDDLTSYIDFPGVNISYSGGNSQVFALARQLPAFWLSILAEQRFARKMIKTIHPDVIISDNRYGMRAHGALTAIVTHQLNVLLPRQIKWLEKPLNYLIRRLINSFDYCLVPDFQTPPGLGGMLSHGSHFTGLKYLGPLSRFKRIDAKLPKPYPFVPDLFYLILLSGPEPQRTLLEQRLTKELSDETCIVFRGLPGNSSAKQEGLHLIFDHGSTALMAWCIEHARVVICRSGYSSIMDLQVFGKKCVLIPTPGQTEQEYLAQNLSQAGYIATLPQTKTHLIKKSIEEAMKLPGLPVAHHDGGLVDNVNVILHCANRSSGRL
jgi:uncharacterized protein (TIGR00661 family)